MKAHLPTRRGVAQPGSAPALGAGVEPQDSSHTCTPRLPDSLSYQWTREGYGLSPIKIEPLREPLPEVTPESSFWTPAKMYAFAGLASLWMWYGIFLVVRHLWT